MDGGLGAKAVVMSLTSIIKKIILIGLIVLISLLITAPRHQKMSTTQMTIGLPYNAVQELKNKLP